MNSEHGGTSGGRRVLFVSREPLLQDLGGSTTYAMSLLRQLRDAGHDITILVTHAEARSVRPWFRRRGDPPKGVAFYTPGFTRLGAWYVRPWSGRAWARVLVRAAARFRFLKPLANKAERHYGDAIYNGAWDLTEPTAGERALAMRTVRELDSQIVIANYAFWAPLFDEPGLRTLRKVIVMHDLLSGRVTRLLESGLALDCPAIDEATELGWLARADVLLAAQQREAEIVRPHVRGSVVVPPMGMEVTRASLPVDADRCLFVGSKILPNYDGLVWFLQEVWPLVLERRPAAKLSVCGTICIWLESRAPAYDRPSVDLLHFVPSLADEYARSAVCVVPLLVGSGIKIKLLEALAYARAVVTTPVGAQGLEAWEGEAFRMADDARGFAEAMLALLSDPAARQRLEASGSAVAEAHFSASSPEAREFLRAVAGE